MAKKRFTEEELKQHKHDYYIKNKDHLRKKQYERYLETRDIRLKYNKEYYEKNKPELLKKTKAYYEKVRAENPRKIILQKIKERAKRKGLEFNLDESDVNIPDVCPFLGIPLFYTKGKQTNNTPSCDRRDNSKGYTKDNVLFMSMKANNMKSDLTPDICRKFLAYMEGEL